jgi:hypothetical protein
MTNNWDFFVKRGPLFPDPKPQYINNKQNKIKFPSPQKEKKNPTTKLKLWSYCAFALVSMNLPFPHLKLEKWENNGSKVKISKNLEFSRLPKIIKKFHLQWWRFFISQPNPCFFGTERFGSKCSILSLSDDVSKGLYLFQSWTVLVK